MTAIGLEVEATLKPMQSISMAIELLIFIRKDTLVPAAWTS